MVLDSLLGLLETVLVLAPLTGDTEGCCAVEDCLISLRDLKFDDAPGPSMYKMC